MHRFYEFGAYVVTAGMMLGGTVGAKALLVSDDIAAAPAYQGAGSGALRNAQYAFRFRYPAGWTEFVSDRPSIVAGAARSDGVFCGVIARATPLPGSDGATRRHPREFLAAADPGYLAVPVAGAATRLLSSEESALGGQPARRYVIEAILARSETLKIEAYATLRGATVLTLSCIAPAARFGDDDVTAAFRLAHVSFRFD
jgi:hypothetical protein